jgi:hypothetical protein
VPVFGVNNYNISDHALPAKFDLSELILLPEQQLAAELAVLLPNVSNSTVLGTARRVLQFAAAYAEIAASAQVAIGVSNSLSWRCIAHEVPLQQHD